MNQNFLNQAPTENWDSTIWGEVNIALKRALGIPSKAECNGGSGYCHTVSIVNEYLRVYVWCVGLCMCLYLCVSWSLVLFYFSFSFRVKTSGQMNNNKESVLVISNCKRAIFFSFLLLSFFHFVGRL